MRINARISAAPAHDLEPKPAAPIPYGRQRITDEDVASVVDALRSDFLTQGPRIADLERSFAATRVHLRRCRGQRHGCPAPVRPGAGCGPGTRVITSPSRLPLPPTACATAGATSGLRIFTRSRTRWTCRPRGACWSPSREASFSGIIPVDFAGLPVNMEAFRVLADEFGCWLIEDACHAPGAPLSTPRGTPVVRQWALRRPGHLLVPPRQTYRCGRRRHGDHQQ